MILRRPAPPPAAPRASRSALIAASVPEDTSRTCSIDGTSLMISSAISTSASVGAPYDRPRVSAACIAASTCGWVWPTIIGPQEPM